MFWAVCIIILLLLIFHYLLWRFVKFNVVCVIDICIGHLTFDLPLNLDTLRVRLIAHIDDLVRCRCSFPSAFQFPNVFIMVNRLELLIMLAFFLFFRRSLSVWAFWLLNGESDWFLIVVWVGCQKRLACEVAHKLIKRWRWLELADRSVWITLVYIWLGQVRLLFDDLAGQW